MSERRFRIPTPQETEGIPPELARFLDGLFRRTGLLVPLVLGVVGFLWLISGVYIVGPGEQGVVRQFGRYAGTTSPGLNYHLPGPIQRVDVVNVEQVRRTEIGFTSTRGVVARDLSEALMLTADENIVEVQLIVQWRVKDPANFIFRIKNPGEVLHTAMETVLRSAVGRGRINDVLTERRAEVQEESREHLQELLDRYEAGILLTAVQLQVVDPPDQVKDAFHDVVRAQEDRERVVNESQAYQADILPKARGEAQRILQEAEGYKQERILRAQGDANRFLAVLLEYQKAPIVTRQRLYLETLERVLSRARTIVLEPGATGNLLPVLPLGSAQGLPSIPTPTITPTPTPTAAAPRR